VVLPWRGALEMEIAERGGHVMQGTGAFIVAGTTHTFCANSNNQFVVADIPAHNMAILHRTAEHFVTNPFFSINAEIQGLLDFMAARIARNHVSGEALIAWGQLLTHSLADGRREPDQHRQKVDQALAFMREHLEQPLSICQIALACGVSESRLYALYKECLGKSPHTCLTEMRLRCAKRLLVQTDLSIAEVAVRTGHADQSALTRKLRIVDNITPAAYRRKARLSFERF
jgi:AraC-like DNA-binding protein